MRGIGVSILIILNIAIFFLPLFGVDTEPYSFSRDGFFSGSYHTIITHMFLHANIYHLIVNMIALLAFGLPIEDDGGIPTMVLIYFITGISAALLFAAVNPASAVGASGAVFGLLAYVALTKPFEFSFFPFVLPLPMALIAVVYTIATLLLLNEQTMVGHWAHFGGIISGAIIAFISRPDEAKHGMIVIGIMAAIILILPFFL